MRASSPQRRFAEGAAALDGRRLEDLDAVGKHLFFRFDDDEVLHVHLGLFGRFRRRRPRARLASLARRRVPIGAALLDQSMIAGLGSVNRPDALFVCGIAPERRRGRCPGRAGVPVGDGGADAARRREARRIVTVSPEELGVPPSRARRGERTYVYRQTGCRRCGGEVARPVIGGRPCYWCPECQR